MSNIIYPDRPSWSNVLFEQLERVRRLEAVPNRGHYQIKVFADDNALDGNLPDSAKILVAGDGKFIFAIPDDLAQSFLWDCFCYVTTVGDSVIRVQLRNITQAQDMLSTRMEIEAGDFTSYDATTQRVIDQSNNQVARGDLIAIDVDNAGGGVAMGLGVGIELNPPAAS
jgi:hypothetical protein